jgi:peptidoglycan/xylan/chitin deacetylase (PgdA/CDA1 family)
MPPSPWRQRVKSLMGATCPPRMLIASGPVAGGSVCLTFDDGPHSENTPRVLDVLGEHGVPATFFVIGERAERHPDLVVRAAREGHAVGNHTFFHREPSETSAAALLGEVRTTRRLLAELLGRPTGLFRPPKGVVSVAKLLRLWAARQTVVLWDTNPLDYRAKSADEVRSWLRANPLRPGALVLMHDDRPFASQVLSEMIRAARDSGLTFTTIPCWTHGAACDTGKVGSARRDGEAARSTVSA